MNRTVTLVGQHQFSALVATALDYAVMIGCVSLLGLSPVWGTVLGALVGAVTNFTLGRRWVFNAQKGQLAGQALRYALVSGVSLLGNAAAVWLLGRAGMHYILARVLGSIVVGLCWNFPMHRHFVFRSAPARASEANG